jgi:PHD/YefM family antitoxin component YafN of YafNO toxin-antitoxin module
VHSDAALAQPVVITRNGRDRLVLLSVERYDELLRAGSSPNAEDQVTQVSKGPERGWLASQSAA